MFGLKFKKREKTPTVLNNVENGETAELNDLNTETAAETDNAVAEMSAEKSSAIAIADCESEKPAEIKEKSGKPKTEKIGCADFARFAEILNKDEKTVLEECKLFQIKKIMGKIEKAVVRYVVTGGEAKNLIYNVSASGLGGVAVSPAYLKDITLNMRDSEEIKICAVIDFPFGESSFKVKLSEMKTAVKAGVDGVLTVFPASMLKRESAIDMKKQLKKTGKTVKGVEKGVAVNAEDADAEEIKRFLRFAEKAGINYAALLFGNVTENMLGEKMRAIKSDKCKISIKVMANVENVAGVKTLIAFGADGIITPYAEKIATELFKEFNITSVKLA